MSLILVYNNGYRDRLIFIYLSFHLAIYGKIHPTLTIKYLKSIWIWDLVPFEVIGNTVIDLNELLHHHTLATHKTSRVDERVSCHLYYPKTEETQIARARGCLKICTSQWLSFHFCFDPNISLSAGFVPFSYCTTKQTQEIGTV